MAAERHAERKRVGDLADDVYTVHFTFARYEMLSWIWIYIYSVQIQPSKHVL